MASAAATMLVAAGSPARGQTRAFAVTGAARTHAVNPAVDDAQRLYEQGRWKDARRAFERAATTAKEEGEYGREAFVGLANAQYMLDDTRGAARTLDELGDRAAAYGDPDTELTAYFKSALLYQAAGDLRSAAARVPQIKTLLKSPVIADATRRMVEERLG